MPTISTLTPTPSANSIEPLQSNIRRVIGWILTLWGGRHHDTTERRVARELTMLLAEPFESGNYVTDRCFVASEFHTVYCWGAIL
jgi:hypothetical protein